MGIGDEWVELERPWGAVGGDPYPDLLRAVRALVEGAQRSSCSWLLEPGELRWEFVREGDKVEIRIFDWTGTARQLVFDGRCRLREFVRAVCSALDWIEGSEDLVFLAEWLSLEAAKPDGEA